jgi:hypothetical protein
MKKAVVIAMTLIGMMTSCVEDKTKYVIAHLIKGDTTTLHKVRVEREFKVGEIVIPVNKIDKFKIVRECR